MEEKNIIEKKKNPNGYWTKEHVLAEARKYRTKNAFNKGCQSAYQSARNKGLLKDMDWFKELHKPKGYWTKERIFEEAHKYRTKMEFHDNKPSLYNRASLNGWLNEMDWFDNGRNAG